MKTAVAAVLIILAYSYFGIVSSAKNVNSYKDLIGYEYGWGLEKAQDFFYQCQTSLINTTDPVKIAEARKIRAREVSFLNSLYSLGFEEPSLEAKKNVEEIYGCDVELRTITPVSWKKVWFLTAAELIQWDGFEFFGLDDLLANLKGFSDILKKIEERYQEGIKQDRRQGTPPHKSSFIEPTLREELEKYLPSIFPHLDDINYCLKKVREDGFSERGMDRETMLYAGALSGMEWELKKKKGPRAYVELLKQHFPLDSGSFSDWIEIVVSDYVYEWGLTEKEIDEFFAATNENARKAGYWFYIVRKGDTLSNISEFIWDTSKYWPVLWEYNKKPGQYYGVRAVTDPKKLKVGQFIALP